MDLLTLLAVISDMSVTLATIAGGIWALYRFRRMRMGQEKLELRLIPKVCHNAKSKAVDVAIVLENKGSVAIYAKDPECLLKVGMIPDDLQDRAVHWREDDLPSLLPQPIEFLAGFGPWNPKKPYIIEPEVTETIHIVFSTNYDGIALLTAEFVDKHDYLYMTKKPIDLRSRTSVKDGV